MLTHTLSKPTSFTIKCSEKVTSFNLQPVTFQRLINIKDILEGKDFEKVLKDPTPLEAVKIAFCMFNDEDKQKLDEIVLKINGKEKKADAMMKLYYLISENNITDGYTNLVSLMGSVNENIINSFQQEEKNEKKKFKILLLFLRNQWNSKKYLILLGVIINILSLLFWMS
jgi:hypothetical protein